MNFPAISNFLKIISYEMLPTIKYIVILLVVENFGAYYMEQKKREVIAKKREDLAEIRKSNNESFKVNL